MIVPGRLRRGVRTRPRAKPPVKALIFLTTRTLVNGVKRALTTPARLIALLFGAFWLIRFVAFPTRGETRAFDPSQLNRATQLLQNVDLGRIMDAIVFAGFTFITFFLALGSLSTRNSFRPADVDVLFPTPVEPKLVLGFRIARDYLLTLIAPLFFVIVGFRPASLGVRSLQNASQDPRIISDTFRVATGAWLLVAFSWVCINYAVSLFVNRSDLASTRNRKILGWVLGLSLIGALVYIAFQTGTFKTWEDWTGLTERPLLRIAFFTATFATYMVHGLVHGELLPLVVGMGSLLLIIIGCLKLSISQAGWMYDQAAVKGFDAVNATNLTRAGDTIGLVAAHARQGKVKAGPTKWLSRLQAKGPWAIVWKEALITFRSSWFVIALFTVITCFLTLFPLLVGDPQQPMLAGNLFMFFQALGIFMSVSVLAQAGFIEMLRRVDVQKPLPFSFSTTVLFEVISKAFPGVAMAWLSSLLALTVRPGLWQEALASAIVMPFLAVLICLVTCLMTILFPDFDDPSQRGFRGLMNFVGILVTCAPATLAMIGLIAFGSSPIIAAVVAAGLNVGFAALVASIAGNRYAQFNPSE